jgi:hypothetical protein
VAVTLLQTGSLRSPISRRSWCVILGLAWILHDGEEWLLAPQMLRFMQSDAPGFLRNAYAGITVSELQAVLLILTAVLLVVIAIAAVPAASATSAFGIMVIAALLGLNAVFHIVLFIHTGIYLAGLVTAVLVSLPVAAGLLVQARRQRWTPAPGFWAAVPAALLVHGPVLDALFKVSLSVVRGAP